MSRQYRTLSRYPHYEYLVIYRRRGWTRRKIRHYRDKHAAFALLSKLDHGGDGRYAPLVELVIERRPLGDPEIIWRLE